jgi:hypothetical protein
MAPLKPCLQLRPRVGLPATFHLSPGLLSGLGVSANYSYTTSGNTKVDQLRTDNPALLRQAPNTWNISPTFDRHRLSIRVGLAYNGPNIFQYQYHDLTRNPDGTTSPNPQPGGVKGPAGDNYLYAHFQVDAQGRYYLGKGVTAIASGLNLNNEVFRVLQRQPTTLGATRVLQTDVHVWFSLGGKMIMECILETKTATILPSSSKG